ncbi:type IIL restriction-modification enzyme MmeI [Aquisalimonas sp.]|uniref:type IIL restriction-modification enzyme MmeI n=1 Tax=Aquisalimonas sp. TaxID=1872621 RepID=UPI0025B7AFA7|nr:type IIL restriction-modification enzyme MmeI [Aquisalimonas sp.]
MALSWNEIRDRAETQTFWSEFFQVFGITRRRVAAFGAHVRKIEEEHGYIDCFSPGILRAEHKSRGRDLKSAYARALWAGVEPPQQPDVHPVLSEMWS